MGGTSRRSLLLGAAALAACGVKSASARLGFQKNGVLLTAKVRNSLDAAAVRGGFAPLEWIEFPAGPPLMEALNAGSIDFGAVGESPPIFAQAAGSKFVYVAQQPVTGANQAILVPQDSPIQTVADLAGRRVAFTRGSSAHLFTLEALRTVGLTTQDIQETPLSPADAAAAFASRNVEAWTIWDPFMSMTLDRGGARVLIDGRTLPRTSSFFVAAPSFATERAAVLTAILDGLAAEAAWANAHVSEAAALISKATTLSAPLIEGSLHRNPLGVASLSPDVIAAQQSAADLFAAEGILPSRIDVTDRVWSGWKGGAQ